MASDDHGPNQATIITDHPIPTTEADADHLQAHNPMFRDGDDVLHPDTLHDRYKEVLAETHEWRVFRSSIYGHEGYVYLWNHQLGYGIRFYDDEGSFRGFVAAMMEAAEVVA